jgi:fused signal recognition particle receptor
LKVNPVPEVEQQQQANWWGRLRQAVTRSREELAERVDQALYGRKEIDPSVFTELEAALLGADIGLDTTTEVLDRLRERLARNELADPAALRVALRDELASRLHSLTPPTAPHSGSAGVYPPPAATAKASPHVVFLVGVNGTGKTTTIAKLAHRWQNEGKRVILCAADTFRAGRSPAPTPQPWCSMPSTPPSHAAPTPSWSTPPAASIPSAT